MSGLITDNMLLPSTSIGSTLSPRGAFPIDKRIMFDSYAEAKSAAESAGEIGQAFKTYYYGMKVCVDDGKAPVWYTIKRKLNTDGNTIGGDLVADDRDGASIVGVVRDRFDANGQWYKMLYSDGRSYEFCAPKGDVGEPGATPKIGENGNWFVGDRDTGERACALVADNQFYLETDNEGNLILHYADGSDPPPILYDEETGELSVELNGVRTEIGRIVGKQGEKGDKGDTGSKLLSIDFVTEEEGGIRYKCVYDDESTAEFVAPRGMRGVQGEKGDKGDTGSKLVDIRLVNEEPGGNRYKCIYDDGTEAEFVAPSGATPQIDQNTGNWVIGNKNTGVRANALSIEGHYYVDVDDDDNLVVYYQDGGAPPNLSYEDGMLYLYLDDSGLVRKELGYVKGDQGPPGEGADIHLEKGSVKNTIHQLNNIAGAKAFKITGCGLISNINGEVKGQYTLRTTEGIKAGMRYVACTSEMNAVGGEIYSVNNTTVNVDGYLDVSLHKRKYGLEDNSETGDVYDYLIVIDDPNDPDFIPGSIGDMEIGHGAVSLGDGSIVFAKNGFSTAKNGKVFGKYGKVSGSNTKAGHCARADGNNTKALGSCTSTDGLDTEATGFASHAGGVGTKARYYGQSVVGTYNKYTTDSSNDRLIVGGGTSEGDRLTCFAAGFNQATNVSYIKVGGKYVTSSNFDVWLNALSKFSSADLAAKTSDLDSYAKKTDLEDYAQKSDIPDVSDFSIKSDIPVKNGSGEGSIVSNHENSYAKGRYSASIGQGTRVSETGIGQTAVGRFNMVGTENDRLVVGGGVSNTDRVNCFSAGFVPATLADGTRTTKGGYSYIKVGSTFIKASEMQIWQNALAGFGANNIAAKTTDIPTVAAIIEELSERISIEADGMVYLITED